MIDTVPAIGASRRSVAAVLHDIVGNIDRMIRSEIRLAKAEAHDDLAAVGGAATLVVAGAALGWLSVAFLLVGAFLLLQTREPPWLAALIVGMGTAVVAGVTLFAGLKNLARTRASQRRLPKSRMESVG